MIAEPENAEQFAEAVRSQPSVLAVGAGTKARLSQTSMPCLRICTRRLRGMVEYDPGEFTFTALAGTPLAEIAAALAEKGQYLPFDPPLVTAGATLGGTIAAGLSGPGRFRYGGLRDFILATRFVDGNGSLLRAGARVVKNAAGFDLPKFFCGSLGRFGALVDATFKVFPRPPSLLTLCVPCESHAQAAGCMAAAARSRWELDALDYQPSMCRVLMRLGGPPAACDALAREITAQLRGVTSLAADEAAALWHSLGEFEWAHSSGVLAKVALTLSTLPAFVTGASALDGCRLHISAGGDVAFVSLDRAADQFDALLQRIGLRALVLRGEGMPVFMGSTAEPASHNGVKHALDPGGRFPPAA